MAYCITTLVISCREARAVVMDAGGLPLGYKCGTPAHVRWVEYIKQTKRSMHTQHFRLPDSWEAAWRHYRDAQAASKLW